MLQMIGKWFGTITVLLLMNLAVDAQAQSAAQLEEQSPSQSAAESAANAYRLTVTIHGSFGLCGDDEFGSQELYVVVKRLDLELQDQINDTEREAQQITGRMSWWHAERRVDSLRKQDFNSTSDPLSEAELESSGKAAPH